MARRRKPPSESVLKTRTALAWWIQAYDKENTMEIDVLVLSLKWIDDLIQGEMVESRNYTREFLRFADVSRDELNTISLILNYVLCLKHSSLVIVTSDDKLVPLKFYKH